MAERSDSAPGVTRLARPPARGEGSPLLTIRIDFGRAGALGPGKVRLLEHVGAEGSITAAGKAMGMSYRRAWLLVDALNRAFRAPLVEARAGGSGGGRAQLTALGRAVIDHYRAVERQSTLASASSLAALCDLLATPEDGEPE